MEEATIKLLNLLNKSKDSGINLNKIQWLKKNKNELFSRKWEKWFILLTIFLLTFFYYSDYFFSENCIVYMPPDLNKAFRKPENCDFCKNVQTAVKLFNVSPDEFEDNYAYKGGPVLVTDATVNWTAMKTFDYWYFKKVYKEIKNKNKDSNCQFFPYKSGFNDFLEGFGMNEDRVNFKKGTKPWYFGWSNCNYEIAKILRKHYNRPYFLPKTSENNAIDWIFMGGPGMGAHMHVDNIRLPSWQAQLRGTKEWILAPPPECYYQCSSFKTTVHPGEIIVLDTNKWYHQTNILPGEISITIGAEYD